LKGSRIYSDFGPDIAWIKSAVQQHASTLPRIFNDAANYYLHKRLMVLSDVSPLDPRTNSLVPYAVFWLAKAFHYDERDSVRRLALAQVYDAIKVTVADDAVDYQAKRNDTLLSLAEEYSRASEQLQSDLFPPESGYWRTLSECKAQEAKHLEWITTAHPIGRPLGDRFLEESSRYMVAVSLPSLAGVALLAGEEDKIDAIIRFLKSYCMTFRIADDIWDWEKDLRMFNLNNSTVLHLAKAKSRAPLTKEAVVSMFLDEDFRAEVYGRILYFLRRAKREARILNCAYLEEFMADQISYHIDQRHSLLDSEKNFRKELSSLLLQYYRHSRSR
jgi:hypothetical protein